MKKITEQQARSVGDRIRFTHMTLQTMLEGVLGDQLDSITVVAALKPKARSKESPCVAVVMGTLVDFDNTIFALKECTRRLLEENK